MVPHGMRDFGPLNAFSVGTLMKEAVRRAIVAIRAHRFTFEARAKLSGRGAGTPDVVTTADHAAQDTLVRLLRAWFPTFGIVAEEDHLRVPCSHAGADLWFTLDPLDGTRAFMRRQSHGIGTMLSLVCDGQVIGACVGDVMTSEIYAARPDDTTVHRVSEFGIAERLEIDDRRTLASQWLLVCERPRRLVPPVITRLGLEQGVFGGFESAAGSIGIAMARVWKSEVGGAVFGPFPWGTPWDLYPVLGISRRLGFGFYMIEEAGLTPWEPAIDPQGCPVPTEILCIHRSREPELAAWLPLAADDGRPDR